MNSLAMGRTRPAKRRIVYKGERGIRNSVVILLIVFNLVLLVVPVAIALTGSFHDWNPLNGRFDPVGIDNYTRMFADPRLVTSVVNTTVFGLVVIAARVVLGLALALAIFSRMTRFKTFFRALFYMPTVTPLVAVAYVWKMMYDPQVGAVNSFLGTDVNWLFDSHWALPAIMLMTIWKDFGYAVILFLAGLYSLPEDVMEAAQVDGAGAWKRFVHVTLPLLRPMMIFVVITSLISYLQTFIQVLVLTKGGPGFKTYLLSYLIYDEAFVKYNFGYASAIAFALFLATAVLTILSFWVTGIGTRTGARPRRVRSGRKAV
ncbi:sugar ABC transporter permease [Brachybacterium huguangmaarense]|uniref:Sugar ABC transporter permease n=1 Tax=Brachybacterium huguangmaarense TaxID=1652028 RepID=A0ABY6G3T8_9MICO|nr:sugar ABC transporter permease [Brachybacterium huguangmaarense]UYG17875.1 sugar ABC transporter permease [Brachybacterium huguangmaarense]